MPVRRPIFPLFAWVFVALLLVRCAEPVSPLEGQAQATLAPNAEAPAKVVPTSTDIPTPTAIATPTALPSPTMARTTCSEQSFFSGALGRVMPYYIFVPPGYSDSDRRYPVLYLLSGVSGDHKEWASNYIQLCAQAVPLIASGQIQPMIVVMPAGSFTPGSGIGSYWFNHAPSTFACRDGKTYSDGQAWGDYVWKDLVDSIDRSYRTLPSATSRAIGGLSAGGEGALTLALTHPERFRIAGAHSPSIRHADGSLCFYGGEDYYSQYDPDWLMRNTNTWKQLTIWMDVGEQDTEWGSAILDFHNSMESLGVTHEFYRFPGNHDDYYWAANTATYLRWYSSKLAVQ